MDAQPRGVVACSTSLALGVGSFVCRPVLVVPALPPPPRDELLPLLVETAGHAIVGRPLPPRRKR